MKSLTPLIAAVVLPGAAILLSACSSPDVQEERLSGVERRQDRIDSRTSARQARWQVRSEREDARSKAYFDSM